MATINSKRHVSRRRSGPVTAIASLFVSLTAIASAAAAGQADASIYGLVSDESGAVLPGVTVTATSPALQVRTVSAVTASDGEYRLTPLPIGIYQVEYALQGFQTVRQESIRLTVGFAARLDVRMSVGSLAETVTVTGASPVVDVTQTSHSTVLTREVLELMPTGRAGVNTLLAQVPGTRALLDIGGSSFNTDPSVSSFGQPGEPQSALEGVITRFAAYWNYLTVDEVQATTVGSGAEVETRGVQINAVSKSGGNQFRGETGLGAGGGPIQSDNVTEALNAQGIRSGSNKVQYRNDVYGDLGGRIKRDKLWFYVAWRETREASEVLDALPKPDGSPAQSIQTAKYFTDKITYQMNPGNRLIGFYAWSYKGNVGGVSQFVPWASRTVQHNNQDLTKGEWQALKGNWLVMSAQYGYWGHAAARLRNENSAPGTVRTQDIGTQYVTGPSTRAGQLNYQNMNDVRLKVTVFRPDLFLGDHELKTGFSVT
ncbi:MAG: carboxypeptidase regulatory-like domain-containing protein, partial [bacterium]